MTPKTLTRLLNLKWMLLVLLAISCPIRAVNAVEFLGSFSKEGFTEEHRYIYQLNLWREGGKLFGYYGFYAGLQGDPVSGMNPRRIVGSLKGKSVLLKSEHVHFSFSGSLSGSDLSGTWSDSMTKGIDITLKKLSSTEIEPALLKASLGSYEAWAHWAEKYLDSKAADNKQLSQKLASCDSGNGQACLGAGNDAALRGNQKRARQLYETGCNLNNPDACRFIGRMGRAREINESRCTGKATMENNFACKYLGEQEEKAGNIEIAKQWYRKGCNDSIPMVCPDFKRLDKP